jgi:hypothetical protein
MAQLSAAVRSHIASQAEDVIEGRLGYWDFINGLPPEHVQDELIAELVDLIEHEPKAGGFLGMSVKEHAKYITRVHEIIALMRG